jgi:hypothetical protein
MKKLGIIVFFLISAFISFGQPVVPRANNSITVQDYRLYPKYNFITPPFADTTAANLQIGIDSCGAQIYTYDVMGLWIRKCSPKRWERNIDYNIYTTDSTIYATDGVRRAQLLSQTRMFWRQGEYEPPETTNIPIFSFGTKDTIISNSYFSAQRKSFEFERVVRFISVPFREYLGGASLGMVIEANDTARIGTVGGDFGYGLRGAIQNRKPSGFSGKTAILSGGYPLDAQPVILSDYLMTGSTSSSNYFKNRGWVSGVTAYYNASQFDSTDNYIGFLASKVNTAKIGTTYGFYDNISGFSGIDSSKSIWSPSGVAHSWIGGKLKVGGGGAWTQIPLGGINAADVQFEVHGNVKVDTGWARIYGSWNTPEDTLFAVAKGGKPLFSVDAVTSYVTASDGLIVATGFSADGVATRIRNNAFLQFSTGAVVETFQQPLFNYRSYPLVNENDLRGFVFGNDTTGTALDPDISDTADYIHIQVNTKSPIDSATREVFHVGWTGKVLARDLPYNATVDTLVGWKDGYLVSTLSSQFGGGSLFARTDARNNTGNDMYFSAADNAIDIDSVTTFGVFAYNAGIENRIQIFGQSSNLYWDNGVYNSRVNVGSDIEITSGVSTSIILSEDTIHLIHPNTNIDYDTSAYKLQARHQITGALVDTYWPTGGGISALAAIGSSPNANGATISGPTLNLEPASATFGGVLTSGIQSIAGAKTFTANLATSLDLNVIGGDISLNSVVRITDSETGSATRIKAQSGITQFFNSGTNSQAHVFNSGGTASINLNGTTRALETVGSNLSIQPGSTAKTGFGIAEGSINGSAKVEIIAGTTTIAPFKLNSGTSLTSPVAGMFEFTTDDLFYTITTGTARKRFLFADPVGGLTSGRVPYVTTNGRQTDNSGFTFSTSAGLGLNTTWTSTALQVGGAISPSANTNGILSTFGGEINEAGSGTHAVLSAASFAFPTINAGAAAVTDATTLYITGAPTASGAISSALFIGGGNIRMALGSKLNMVTGANASIGTSTLSSGTLTINTTAVTSSSIIFLTLNTPSGTIGNSYSAPVGSIVDGTSFVINSVDAAGAVETGDNSTVNWVIIN